jgi:hypothetical protein
MNTKICCDGDCEQGRYCPYGKQKGIVMTEGTRQWLLGMLTGALITGLIAVGISKIDRQQNPAAHVDMPKDIIQSYNMGLKDALKTNPPSMDLEQTCVNMWADKQPLR